MNHFNTEPLTSDIQPHEKEPTFADKLKELLPGVLFEETKDIYDARRAVSEALMTDDPELHKEVWVQYAVVCETFVTNATGSDRASRHACDLLRVSMTVHKALIFDSVSNTKRYIEDLGDAEVLAHHSHLHAIAKGIRDEIDRLLEQTPKK